MKVLVVGGGGREHALAWKISKSPECDELFLAPGNPLSGLLGTRVDIPVNDIVALKYFVKKEGIDLTVVGPEVPLVAGIVDSFESEGLKVFGPSKAASQLEGSKTFSKNIMKKYHIPTADYEVANSYDDAMDVLADARIPIVIKADGLAEGKGAFVCKTEEEANEAIHAIFKERRFGESGANCVFEEFMEGEEASLFVLTDGNTIVPLVAAQDHKPAFDDDRGPNTGGMGSYAPAPIMTPKVLEKVLKEIVVPTIHGMNAEGSPYKGLLYTGLMIKNGNPRVVEYNCRFGDPETQPLMMLLKSDILPIMNQIASGNIDEDYPGLEWHEGSAIGVVLASGGYPGSYTKDYPITGITELSDDIEAFAAGVSGLPNELKTSGGRVLCLTALGEDLAAAREKLYGEIDTVKFKDSFYRTDIGAKGLV
ncbi:MAG: phosphoribosylamine--glycine ligase [Planctomycetes bacterium]|nr:phosphoribosylamine--glycine ligase [Planctomycetota bacterium]